MPESPTLVQSQLIAVCLSLCIYFVDFYCFCIVRKYSFALHYTYSSSFFLFPFFSPFSFSPFSWSLLLRNNWIFTQAAFRSSPGVTILAFNCCRLSLGHFVIHCACHCFLSVFACLSECNYFSWVNMQVLTPPHTPTHTHARTHTFTHTVFLEFCYSFGVTCW